MKSHSLSVGHRHNETAFHTIFNVTYFLLVIGKDVIRLPFTKCHSQADGHRERGERSDETAFHKVCNVTHKLLVIGQDVMCLSQNVQYHHSLPVSHRRRCDEIPFHNTFSSIHISATLKQRY